MENPYAPPTTSIDDAGGGLVFSAEGGAVVSGLATWMRALSIFYYLLVAAFALGGCAVFIGPGGLPMGLAMFVGAILFVLSAMWLRSAGSDFERGVMGDDEMPIGQGFRSLRAYFIMMGIFAILQLGFAFLGVVMR